MQTNWIKNLFRQMFEKTCIFDDNEAQVVDKAGKTHCIFKRSGGLYTCTMKLALPGQNLVARDAESDLYAAIDLATKKIQAQLRKRHNKFKARNHKVAASAKQALQAIAA